MCVFMVRSRVKTERESEVEAAIEREWLEVLPLEPPHLDVVRVKSREGQERDLLRRRALTR
jgi:hypothetical protein